MTRTLLLLALTGCFDSIVSDHCAKGFSLEGGHCVVHNSDTMPDGGGIGIEPDAPGSHGGGGDANTCSADVTSDPDNCGACGIVCASGVCTNGVCGTGFAGQVIAIGHDYTHHHATMARVLGDAVSLGLHQDIAVARYTGTAAGASVAKTTQALTQSMQAINRAWHWVPFPEMPGINALAQVDVVLVQAQLGDGDAVAAAATPWQSAFDTFLARGGVVVVLEASSGVSYRFAGALSLYTSGAPVDVSGQLAYVVDAADAVTQQVISPYMAESSSVTLPGATGAVIATSGGDPVAIHLAHP